MSVILAVFYLATRLAGYSVNPEISCGACKLARTLRLKKKKGYTVSCNIISSGLYQKSKTYSLISLTRGLFMGRKEPSVSYWKEDLMTTCHSSFTKDMRP